MGAIAAQILGQAVAGWSLLAHVVDWNNASVWVIAPLVAAIAVPFRHDGSLRDRATGNFGAAIVVAGLLIWEVALGGLANGGLGFGLVATLMLVATVLFSLAGAFFWVLREADRR
jgi:hypothetical protein